MLDCLANTELEVETIFLQSLKALFYCLVASGVAVEIPESFWFPVFWTCPGCPLPTRRAWDLLCVSGILKVPTDTLGCVSFHSLWWVLDGPFYPRICFPLLFFCTFCGISTSLLHIFLLSFKSLLPFIFVCFQLIFPDCLLLFGVAGASCFCFTVSIPFLISQNIKDSFLEYFLFLKSVSFNVCCIYLFIWCLLVFCDTSFPQVSGTHWLLAGSLMRSSQNTGYFPWWLYSTWVISLGKVLHLGIKLLTLC